MKKIEELWYWDDYYNREFDFLYIVPTKKRTDDWYCTAYYLWAIWEEIKILDIYDCWRLRDNTDGITYINFDFECPFVNWIKIWCRTKKLKYSGSWSFDVDIKV
jgi:hypothetical protein